MKFYLVHMTHNDLDRWKKHVDAHVDYLKTLVEKQVLRASGPVAGGLSRQGFLIMTVESYSDVLGIARDDPFAINGLIDELEIHEWNPIFGVFSGEASPMSSGDKLKG
jgi:uncharacterized protein YciI